MPATVGGYHLFQYCLGAQPEEHIRFEEIETDLGGGYGTTTGFGVNTGIRRFVVKFPTLPGAVGQATISYNGSTLTPADYLWALFCDSKDSGVPFVVQSPRNDQYYLVKFADRELSYARMLTKLFSSGVEFKQFRLPDVSVFDPTNYNDAFATYDAEPLDVDYDDGDTIDAVWPDTSGNGRDLSTGTVETFETNEQNGLPIVRFNGTDSWFLGGSPFTCYEVFVIMKVREATWSNFGGVLTGNTNGVTILVGESGSTKFIDNSYASDYEYRLNGLLYSHNDMQAPMNEFGLVHVRSASGLAIDLLQVGKDRGFAGRYGKIDIGYIDIFDTLKPMSEAREYTEHLLTHWDI